MFSPPFFVFVAVGGYLGSSLGVAIGASLYYALVKPINSWLVLRGSMSLRDFLEIYVAPPLLAGAAIGGAYAAALLTGRALVQIAVIAALGPLAYLALLRLLLPGVLRELLDRFPVDRMIRRLMRKGA